MLISKFKPISSNRILNINVDQIINPVTLSENRLRQSQAKLFSCEYGKIFKNTFFYKTPPVTASEKGRSKLQKILIAEKNMFSSKDIFSKCHQIHSFQGICSHLLKETLIIYGVTCLEVHFYKSSYNCPSINLRFFLKFRFILKCVILSCDSTFDVSNHGKNISRLIFL